MRTVYDHIRNISYIKDTNGLKKVPDSAILVTADVFELYPSIPHDKGLEVLKKQLDYFDDKSIPTEDLVKIAEFVLKITILSLIQV